ncbi:AraC family transcriptional regulator [Fulvivirga lutimaris]|uniref:AraC family transcriptional regulator n=1 Tax=Fulvivirga lutimaris TaxID=1819566 RepID=UPI0012BB9425|nr:AraC family transcriptional regulator [Fulvivirga lutimaris]MTI38930.1 AraC family transcriptional regulator [Fulvivirga lutimaris]
MKPVFEKIDPSFGSSFTVQVFDNDSACHLSNWHVHPEIELVLIKNGHGKRHVGNSITHYSEGDLILLGSYVPHASFSNNIHPDNREIVIQFKREFLGTELFDKTEFKNINKLLNKAQHGLTFGPEVKDQMFSTINSITEKRGFDRLLTLLHVLQSLSQTEDFKTLSTFHKPTLHNPYDQERINAIYDHVSDNYQKSITIDEMADIVNMTVPSFCRFFKRATNKTFSLFLNQYRISQACDLLIEKNLAVGEIAYQVGFQSATYFNSQFKKIVGQNPACYIKSFHSQIKHN